MDTNVERIAALFSGLERAHGCYELTGTVTDKGKQEGKAFTRREPVTLDLWTAHVRGEKGLGIVPIDDDGMCSWGSIDVDDYALDHNALQAKIVELGLPLVMTASKSVGGHLDLFMTERVPASWMVATLTKWKIALGYPKSEIFPKQIKLANENDTGNWLNMPYFGDTRKMWKDKSLGYFLDYAESMKQTMEMCDAIKLAEVVVDPLKEMPPCLEIIAKEGAPEGTRNNVMFNYGVFVKKAYPDKWESKLLEANRTILDRPLPQLEVDTLIKSLTRDKDYFYTCSAEPICGKCDKPTCKTRKFGIGGGSGSGGLTVSINGLSKLETDPPVWYLDVDGYRVEIGSKQLFSFGEVKVRCADVLTKHIGTIKQGDWDIIVADLMVKCDVVAMPEDAGTIGAFKNHLNDFLTSGSASPVRDDMLNGRPWYNEKEKRYYFRLADLTHKLDTVKFRDYTTSQVTAKLKVLGAEHGMFNVKGACCRWWAITQLYEPQNEAFDVPETGVPMQ